MIISLKGSPYEIIFIKRLVSQEIFAGIGLRKNCFKILMNFFYKILSRFAEIFDFTGPYQVFFIIVMDECKFIL